MNNIADLLAAAWQIRGRAYAPYSRFKVGAAVLGTTGRIYCGCNVENASFGLTVCAERVAVFQAVAAGERELTALAVVSDAPVPAMPCGACRQVMAEFGIELVVAANLAGQYRCIRLSDLLPQAFSAACLALNDDAEEEKRDGKQGK